MLSFIFYNSSLYSPRPDTLAVCISCVGSKYTTLLFGINTYFVQGVRRIEKSAGEDLKDLVARMNAIETESYRIRNAFRLAGRNKYAHANWESLQPK